jgi:hypothetical protein
MPPPLKEDEIIVVVEMDVAAPPRCILTMTTMAPIMRRQTKHTMAWPNIRHVTQYHIGETTQKAVVRSPPLIASANVHLAPTAIIASSFNGGGMEINFADVEKSLSSKLTDDDLHALLVCLDAKNH